MDQITNDKTTMTRREVLMGAGVVLAAAAAPQVFAAEEHHHGMMNKHGKLVETTLHCIRDGEACLDHCLKLFKTGDTSVADCAATVTEMLAMCTAMHKMASHDSKYAGQLASVCLKVCQECEKQCNKHAKKHEACAACARSCKECIRECEKIAA